MKHTPGPWKVDTAQYNSKQLSRWCVGPEPKDPINGLFMPVCKIAGDPRPASVNDANARLIAAAPDYDLAAREMVKRHDNAAKLANFQACGCDDCKPFRAIIAKAEGQS